VQYLQYLDKYREYQRFDTSIKKISIHRDISWCHDITKYRDMTIAVLIPCNCATVDNCTLRDSNENTMSVVTSKVQNYSCRPKLVICLQFAHTLISVLWKRRISSSLWCFVNFCDLTVARLMGIDLLRWLLMTKFCLRCLSHVVYVFIVYISFCKVCCTILHNNQGTDYLSPIMKSTDHNYVELLERMWVPHWNSFEFDMFEADQCRSQPRKQICSKIIAK